jgi:hypothetical protein
MLHKLAIGVAISMIALITMPLLVVAQEEIMTIAEDISTTSEPASQDVTAEARATQREARIRALKEKKDGRIAASEERIIESRCRSAQVVVDKLQSRLNKVVDNRREKYSNLTSRLNELMQKLQLAGVDTTELEAAIVEIELISTSALTTIETYYTNLSDLATMDCESDPAGFKALIDEARSKRVEIVSLQGTLKSSINEKVKPILQSIRSNLETTNKNLEGEE